MATIQKRDLTVEVSRRTGITQVDVKVVIEILLETVAGYLRAKKKISIRKFGTFRTTHLKKKMGRNPRNGDAVEIPEQWAPRLRFAKEFKKKINQRKD